MVDRPGDSQLREFNEQLLTVASGLAGALILAGFFAGNGHTTAFYLVLGTGIGIPAIMGRGRLARAESLERLGTVGIQHSWITGSLGLAFLSLVPSTFFSAPGWVKAVAALAGAIWVLVGVYGLWVNSRRAGVPISI